MFSHSWVKRLACSCSDNKQESCLQSGVVDDPQHVHERNILQIANEEPCAQKAKKTENKYCFRVRCENLCLLILLDHITNSLFKKKTLLQI